VTVDIIGSYPMEKVKVYVHTVNITVKTMYAMMLVFVHLDVCMENGVKDARKIALKIVKNALKVKENV
jgi:hypothetical protein